MQKQKVAKTFKQIRTSCLIFVAICKIRFLDSFKVSESPLIHDSPKWILRYAQYDDSGGLLRSLHSLAMMNLPPCPCEIRLSPESW